MKTDSVVFTAESKAEFQCFEMPRPAPGQVQVRTLASTIRAGTEGWCLKNQFTWQPTPYPCVSGYQRVGVITELGDGVMGWAVGDKCAVTIGYWEGTIVPFWGSHGSVLNSPASELYRIPDGVDDVSASSLVVAQVGYNAAFRADLQPDDWVIVYGDGLIGQFGAQSARARGMKVILVGHRQERLDIAMGHSADYVINSHHQSVADEVQKLTGGTVACVIDTIQTEASQREYLALLENGRGQIVYSGFTPGVVWADMGLLQQRELTTHYVAGWTRARIEATLGLMAEGAIRVRPLISHKVSAARGAEMFEMVLHTDQPFLGITLDWTGGDE
ncbi:MAG: zinc-binding dehydrogenase [Armatimonadota bacterium]